MPPGPSPTAHQPFFQGAPVTKLMSFLWIAGHVIRQSQNQKSHTLQSQSQWLNLNRFLFASTGELVVGIMFLAHLLRRLERELGSRKLIVWLLWVPTVVAVLELVFAQILLLLVEEEDVGMELAQGPYAYIGAVLYWYYAYIPRLHPRFVSVGGIAFSEKAVHYLWGLYLIGSQGTGSFLLTTMGILASVLFFRLPVPDLPNSLVSLLPWESLGSLLFLDPPPKIYAPLLMATAPMNGNLRGGRAATAPRRNPPTNADATANTLQPAPAAAPLAPPPQASIDQLTAMGFEEARVRQALQQNDNNVERAADRLLTSN
jgi:hypothetical protein